MRSEVVKRSVSVGRHKTSITLEEGFWQGLRDIAAARQTTLSTLLDEIDHSRSNANLSSHIRLFVLDYYRSRNIASTSSSSPA